MFLHKFEQKREFLPILTFSIYSPFWGKVTKVPPQGGGLRSDRFNVRRSIGRMADDEGQWRMADREKFLLLFSNAVHISLRAKVPFSFLPILGILFNFHGKSWAFNVMANHGLLFRCQSRAYWFKVLVNLGQICSIHF